MKQFLKKWLLLELLFCAPLGWAGSKDLANLAQALEQLNAAAEGEQQSPETAKALTNLETWTDYCFKNFPEGYHVTYTTQLDIMSAQKIMDLRFKFKKEITDLVNKASATLENNLFNKGDWYGNRKLDKAKWGFETLQENAEYVVEMKKLTSKNSLCFVGDIHGSIHSLLRILWDLVLKGLLTPDFKITSDDFILVFLGDYIDRGSFGLEVLYTVLRLFVTNPNNVILLRGNHEALSYQITEHNDSFTFGPELIVRFFPNTSSEPWGDDIFYDLFRRLPLGFFMTCSDFVLQLCHGGPILNVSGEGAGCVLLSLDALDNTWSTSKDYHRVVGHNEARFLSWTDFRRIDKMPKGTPEINVTAERPVIGSSMVTKIAAKQKINLFVRGHQHDRYTCKLLPQVGTTIIEQTTFSGKQHQSNPQWWCNVVDQKELATFSTNGIPLDKLPLPVLTFTTATGFNVSEQEGFGILTLADKFADCRLHVHERTILGPSELRVKKAPLTNEEKNSLAGTLTGALEAHGRPLATYPASNPAQKSYLYPSITCNYKTKKLTVEWTENPATKPVIIVK